MYALVASTQFFLLPMVCANVNKIWLRWIMLLTYMTSSAYHLTESHSLMIVDRVASRTCTAMMFYHIAVHSRGTYAILLLNNVSACYVVSRVLSHYQNDWWVVAHVYFHAWSAMTWLITIYI